MNGYSESASSADGLYCTVVNLPLPRGNPPLNRYGVPGCSGVGHGHCSPPSSKPRVAHPRQCRPGLPELPEYFNRMRIGHFIAHALRKFHDNERVLHGAPGRAHRPSHPLNAALAVRERPDLFRKRHAGQDHVRKLCGFCHEDILDDQEIERLQRLYRMVCIGVGDHRDFLP